MKKMTVCLMALGLLFALSACGNNSSISSISSKALPEENSAGAKLLKANCSQCHGVPSATDHVAAHWPNVIERMQRHRIKNAYYPVKDQDKQIITAYLQKHAAE